MRSLLRFSQDPNQRVDWAEFLSGDSGEESVSVLIWTEDRFQFLMIIG